MPARSFSENHSDDVPVKLRKKVEDYLKDMGYPEE